MLSVAEALSRVLEHATAKPPSDVALADALGLVLAEDIVSDIDSPQHDKSMVDGYAINSADLKAGRAQLEVLEEVTAGSLPTRSVTSGHGTRIMTGAPIPAGADAVVMIELTKLNGSLVEIKDNHFQRGQNILPCGKSLRRGDVVLQRGALIGPAEIGLLAEVGRARMQAIGPVTVALLSTGNELVPADKMPSAGQIRNSNGPLLTASVQKAGAMPIDLGIARDEVADLRRAISQGLESEVLLISGGVSAGVLDLVPKVLMELGVEQVFHKVNLKPGKPLWFGVQRTKDNGQRTTLVFGLPGNPISSLVCFELFVKPAIAKIADRSVDSVHRLQAGKLACEFVHRGDRPTYHPAVWHRSADGATVEPIRWQGSADLRGFVGANALIAFPAGDRSYQAGETVDVLLV